MAQFYPAGMREMALNQAETDGAINVPPEEDFNTEAMQGSLQQILSENLGIYVVVEFLIGTQTLTRKEGILYSVGRSVLALYEEDTKTFVVCDIFSVKFVTFYLPGQRPGQRPLTPEEELALQLPPPVSRSGRTTYRTATNR